MKKMILLLSFAVVVSVVGAVVVSADDEFGGGDIAYKTVNFSHETHVGGLGFECDSCHDGLFEMEANAASGRDDFTMANLNDGRYCGTCHDGGMAFSGQEECGTCHVRDGGDIVFDQPVKAVVFSHQYHGQDLGFSCESCHLDTFDMEAQAAQESTDFTMNGLDEGKYCGVCHDGQTAFASNTRCATCHIGVQGFDRLSSERLSQVESH